MEQKRYEQLVFLMEIKSEEEMDRLLNAAEGVRFSATEPPRRFAMGTPDGHVYWGSDDVLRPMGHHTSSCRIIGKGLVSVDEYIEFVKVFTGMHYEYGPAYIVNCTPDLQAQISEDGYYLSHRPAFARVGCAPGLITLYPYRKSGVDAGMAKLKNLTAEEYLELCERQTPETVIMTFARFRERVRDVPPCEGVIVDDEGRIRGVEGEVRGIVRLPEGPVAIAEGGLNLPYMTDLILPESVTVLEEHALENCVSLRRIFIPATLGQIYSRAVPFTIRNVYYGGGEKLWRKLCGKSPITRTGTRSGYAYGNFESVEKIDFDCVLDNNAGTESQTED